MITIYELSAVLVCPTWRVFVFGLAVCGGLKVSVNRKASVNCSDHQEAVLVSIVPPGAVKRSFLDSGFGKDNVAIITER